MPFEEARIEALLNPLRSLKSRPRQAAIAECARLIQATCKTEQQAQTAIAELTATYDRWPGPATFQKILARHSGHASETADEFSPAEAARRSQILQQAWRELNALQRPADQSLEAATWRRIRAMSQEHREDLIEACQAIVDSVQPYSEHPPAKKVRSLHAVIIAAAGAAWSTHGQELQTWETPDYIRNPPPIACAECKDTGLCRDQAGILQWCDCPFATQLCKEMPLWLEMSRQSDMRAGQATAPKPKPAPMPAPAIAAPARVVDVAVCGTCGGQIKAFSDGRLEPCQCPTSYSPVSG